MSSPAPRPFAARTAATLAALTLVITPSLAVPQTAGAAVRSGANAAARDGKVLFRVSDSRITESSGLAVSVKHPGITYTHNDSGGVAQVFALGPDGSTKAVYSFGGARARDWEAMAMGRDEKGRPAIYAADIGDNLGGAWPYVTVYRIPEPSELRSQTIHATTFKFKYEDGPRNAETLMINPKTNRLYIASKLFSGALYEAPAKLRTSGYNKLHKIGDAPAIATDGAFAPDGRSFVIRTYFGARIYSVKDDGRPGKSRGVSLPAQEQGESVTYTADGRSLLAGSEGENQPVYEVPLPKEVLPSPTASAGVAGNGKDDADKGKKDSRMASGGLILVVAIAAVVGYGVVRRRS